MREKDDRVAIYGDFSRCTSKPLKDFMRESNRGRDVFFVVTEEEAIAALTRLTEGGRRMPLEIVRNDLTKMAVDAIVNAANPTLLGGGGVDGAIHRAAGPQLLAECRTLGGCKTGEAKLTGGYRLPCRYVIHTVGPVWQGGTHGERAQLAACYRNSLALAKARGCESAAFPLISAGAYGYPKAQAMQVAVETIAAFLMENDMTVYLVVFARDAFELGGKLFCEVKAYIDDVYADEHTDAAWERMRRQNLADECVMCECPVGEAASLNDLLEQVDEGFSRTLLRLIDERHMTDAECYKRANIDRRLFSKIRNNPDYRPGKSTVLAFAIALRLTIAETKALLERAGFALSHSSKMDIVVEYCIQTGHYDVIEINQLLFELDLPLLGC